MPEQRAARQGAIKDPARTFAVIAGAASYGTDGLVWEEFTREGLDHDAVRFADWLLRQSVPADNIRLLLSSAAEPPELPAGLLRSGPPDYSQVTSALRWLKKHRGRELWVYWVGHGFVAKGGHQRVYLSDSLSDLPRCIAVQDVIDFCATIDITNQTFVFDACRESVQPIASTGHSLTPFDNLVARQGWQAGPAPLDLPAPDNDRLSEIDQVGFYACLYGQSAKHTQDGAVFSRAFRSVLDSTAVTELMTDRAELLQAVQKELDDYEQTPTEMHIYLRGRHFGWQSRAAQAGPERTYDLGAFTADPAPGRARLDIAWGLIRDPVRAVIADYADADLLRELSALERLIADETGQALGPARLWRAWSPADDPLTPADGGRPASVARIDLPDGPYDADTSHTPHRTIRLHPDQPGDFIVQVRAVLSTDATRAAEHIARELRGTLGGEWPVLVRNAPGDPPASILPDAAVATPDFLSVADYLTRMAAVRGLPGPTLPQPGSDDLIEPADPRTPGTIVGDVMVQAFARYGIDAATENEFLCAVRDFAPQWFRPLIRCCAQRERGWRGPALLLADRDDLFDVWLTTALDAGHGCRPDDFDPVPELVADAMCLGHFRRGARSAAMAWARRNTSPGVTALCRSIQRNSDRDRFTVSELSAMEPAAARAACRTGWRIDFSSTDLDRLTWRGPGLWAAVAAHPLSEATLALFTALPPEQQPLWGLIREPEDEPVVQQELRQLQRLIRTLPIGSRGPK